MNPNIVLVTIDCLRYDHCGFNGYQRETTPFLDKLADNSYVFDRAYASGPWTPESFTGILAGRHSYNSPYVQNYKWKALAPEENTIATFLNSSGYTTFAEISNVNLTADRNFDRGFEHFRNARAETGKDGEEPRSKNVVDVGEFIEHYKALVRRFDRTTPLLLPYLVHRFVHLHRGWPTVDGGDLVDRFMDLFERQNRPTFGWVHLMDLHPPIHPRIARTGGFCSGWSNTRLFYQDAKQACQVKSSGYTDIYDGAIRYIDHQLKRLVERLKEARNWKDTILIVTADHGEALFDRGIYQHPAHYLFDELLHVPLLVHMPEEDGKRIEQRFSLAWMHELIAEVADLNVPSFPASSGRAQHLVENEGVNPLLADSLDIAGHTIAVLDPPHKLLRHYDGSQTLPQWAEHLGSSRNTAWVEGTIDAYYDLEKDPSEMNPKPLPETLTSLADVAESVHTEPGELRQLGGEISEKTMQKLADLGYRQ